MQRLEGHHWAPSLAAGSALREPWPGLLCPTQVSTVPKAAASQMTQPWAPAGRHLPRGTLGHHIFAAIWKCPGESCVLSFTFPNLWDFPGGRQQ